MFLIGDRERELAAASLQRHYVQGRLSTDELAHRLQRVLRARDQRDLRTALVGLPPIWRDGHELWQIGRRLRRGAILLLLLAAWLFVSFVLLVAFAVSALSHGVTTAESIAFPLVWLGATVLVWRAGSRA